MTKSAPAPDDIINSNLQLHVLYSPKALATSPGQVQPPSCVDNELFSRTITTSVCSVYEVADLW